MLRKAHAFGGIFWNPVRCLGQGKARLLYALSETQRRIAEQMINAQKLRERACRRIPLLRRQDCIA